MKMHSPYAKFIVTLLQEWCELSVRGLVTTGSNEKNDRRTNFLSVASRSSSHHLLYHRDLLFLLTHSMEIKEHGLALDLGEWFVCVVPNLATLVFLTLTTDSFVS